MYEKKGRYIVEFPDIPSERQHQIEIDVEERRRNYNEVELGFDEERALKEARRCLSCRRCLGCALCWAECKPEAIDFAMEDDIVEVEADMLIVSSGVERAQERIDDKFQLGSNLNVITDLQMERMLDEDGPSKGLVIRPYDGEVPARIGFVQSYEAAASGVHRAALCLAVNEAILLRGKLPEAEISIIAGELTSFQQEYAADLEKLADITFQEAAVVSVDAGEKAEVEVTLATAQGEECRSFDLLVLLTQPQLSAEVKKLTSAVGLEVDYANFFADGDGAALLATEKDQVQLAAQR